MKNKYVRVVGIYGKDIDPQIDLILKNNKNGFVSEGLSFLGDAEPLINNKFDSLITLQFVVKFSLSGKEIASNTVAVKFHTSKEFVIADDSILDEIIKEAYSEFYEDTVKNILPVLPNHKMNKISDEIITTVKDQLLVCFAETEE